MAWHRPTPATVKLPLSTVSPGCLKIGSASPVSSDSFTSRPRTAITRPSTTTWSPGRNSNTSSSTTSLTGISTTRPSRTTLALGAVSSVSRSRVFLARSSWMMPMAVLAIITRPNRASAGGATIRTITSITLRIQLKRVKTLLRMISAVVRLGP